MSQSSPASETPQETQPELSPPTEPTSEPTSPVAASRPPSFVKSAMRNMVRKRGTSLYHFALTTLGLLSALIGLAYLTR